MGDFQPAKLAGQVTRRTLLGAGVAAIGAAALPQPFGNGATLLVGGPDNGLLDHWADWLDPGLSRVLAPETGIRRDHVGGSDGVTAANQFEARIVPDGGTALIVPGLAAMAWLVGDPRARFDAARWVPALAAVTPSLVASRIPASRIAGRVPLRLAVSDPAGPDLPAMLALDLMGANWRPVFGLTDAAAQAALAQGGVDAICLHGRRVVETANALGRLGAPPVFTLGMLDEIRDPALAGIPDAAELLPTAGLVDEPLRVAWRATVAAGRLEAALVLPHLTPAALVALWRRACAQAAGSAPVQALAVNAGVRALPVPAATAVTTAVTADAASLLALRHWMATRLEYRPD